MEIEAFNPRMMSVGANHRSNLLNPPSSHTHPPPHPIAHDDYYYYHYYYPHYPSYTTRARPSTSPFTFNHFKPATTTTTTSTSTSTLTSTSTTTSTIPTTLTSTIPTTSTTITSPSSPSSSSSSSSSSSPSSSPPSSPTKRRRSSPNHLQLRRQPNVHPSTDDQHHPTIHQPPTNGRSNQNQTIQPSSTHHHHRHHHHPITPTSSSNTKPIHQPHPNQTNPTIPSHPSSSSTSSSSSSSSSLSSSSSSSKPNLKPSSHRFIPSPSNRRIGFSKDAAKEIIPNDQDSPSSTSKGVEPLLQVSLIAIQSIWTNQSSPDQSSSSSSNSSSSKSSSPTHQLTLLNFIREVLRRSRTNSNTLKLSLFYLHQSRRTVRERISIADRARSNYQHLIQKLSTHPSHHPHHSHDPSPGPTTHHQPSYAYSSNSLDHHLQHPPSTVIRSSEKLEIDRLLKLIKDPVLSGRRMFLASLMCASKYLQDRNFSNRAWAKIAGLPTHDLNANEKVFLSLLDYRLHVDLPSFEIWSIRLQKLMDEKNMTSCDPPTGHDDHYPQSNLDRAEPPRATITTLPNTSRTSIPSFYSSSSPSQRIQSDQAPKGSNPLAVHSRRTSLSLESPIKPQPTLTRKPNVDLTTPIRQSTYPSVSQAILATAPPRLSGSDELASRAVDHITPSRQPAALRTPIGQQTSHPSLSRVRLATAPAHLKSSQVSQPPSALITETTIPEPRSTMTPISSRPAALTKLYSSTRTDGNARQAAYGTPTTQAPALIDFSPIPHRAHKPALVASDSLHRSGTYNLTSSLGRQSDETCLNRTTAPVKRLTALDNITPADVIQAERDLLLKVAQETVLLDEEKRRSSTSTTGLARQSEITTRYSQNQLDRLTEERRWNDEENKKHVQRLIENRRQQPAPHPGEQRWQRSTPIVPPDDRPQSYHEPASRLESITRSVNDCNTKSRFQSNRQSSEDDSEELSSESDEERHAKHDSSPIVDRTLASDHRIKSHQRVLSSTLTSSSGAQNKLYDESFTQVENGPTYRHPVYKSMRRGSGYADEVSEEWRKDIPEAELQRPLERMHLNDIETKPSGATAALSRSTNHHAHDRSGLHALRSQMPSKSAVKPSLTLNNSTLPSLTTASTTATATSSLSLSSSLAGRAPIRLDSVSSSHQPQPPRSSSRGVTPPLITNRSLNSCAIQENQHSLYLSNHPQIPSRSMSHSIVGRKSGLDRRSDYDDQDRFLYPRSSYQSSLTSRTNQECSNDDDDDDDEDEDDLNVYYRSKNHLPLRLPASSTQAPYSSSNYRSLSHQYQYPNRNYGLSSSTPRSDFNPTNHHQYYPSLNSCVILDRTAKHVY